MAISLREIQLRSVRFGIKGTSPMIQHAWAEKGLREMRMSKKARAMDKKQNPPGDRDPEGEAEAATYRTEDGGYGIPVTALKSAIISAAHKDLGVEKTAVRKALFLKAPVDLILPMECDEPICREDIVRIGMGSTDLRYRPEFRNWRVMVDAVIDIDLINADVLANLVTRAGFGVGIGEWRPERGGDFGRFELDQTVPFEVEGG